MDKNCHACKSGYGFIVRYLDSRGVVRFFHDTCVGSYLMINHDLSMIFAPGPHDKEPKVVDLMARLQLSLAHDRVRKAEGIALTIEEAAEEPEDELVFTGPKLVRELIIDG